MGEEGINKTMMPMNVKMRYKCLEERKHSTETNYKRTLTVLEPGTGE